MLVILLSPAETEAHEFQAIPGKVGEFLFQKQNKNKRVGGETQVVKSPNSISDTTHTHTHTHTHTQLT
jgi:hypothetical protein